MSEYTRALTAEQLIYMIAHDRPELSHDKVMFQRNEVTLNDKTQGLYGD